MPCEILSSMATQQNEAYTHSCLYLKLAQPEAFCDAWKSLKSVFGWDSAPVPAGRAHDAPSNPPPFLVGWGWETLSFSSSMDTPFTDILLMAEVDSRPHPKLKSNTPLDVFRLLERGRTGAHQTHQTGLGLHTWSPTFETFCDA